MHVLIHIYLYLFSLCSHHVFHDSLVCFLHEAGARIFGHQFLGLREPGSAIVTSASVARGDPSQLRSCPNLPTRIRPKFDHIWPMCVVVWPMLAKIHPNLAIIGRIGRCLAKSDQFRPTWVDAGHFLSGGPSHRPISAGCQHRPILVQSMPNLGSCGIFSATFGATCSALAELAWIAEVNLFGMRGEQLFGDVRVIVSSAMPGLSMDAAGIAPDRPRIEPRAIGPGSLRGIGGLSIRSARGASRSPARERHMREAFWFYS